MSKSPLIFQNEIHGTQALPHMAFLERSREMDYTVVRSLSYMTEVEKPDEVDMGFTVEYLYINTEDNRVCFYSTPYGNLYLWFSGKGVNATIVGDSEELVNTVCDLIQEKLPPAKPEEDHKIIANFWYFEQGNGAQCSQRHIDIPYWDEIRDNYATETVEKLDDLMANNPVDLNGQLILWNGEPGTGKTYALRALGHRWRDVAEFHYIVDPEIFFNTPNYMMNVLLRNTEKDRYKLIVLEDSGEMLTADAKQRVGQGLSRLLNIVDGILGQGLKLMVLVTTNEELKSLHPAVSRDGRCAAICGFEALDVERANQWIKTNKAPLTIDRPMNLSELYRKLAPVPKIETKSTKRGPGFVWQG